MRVEFIEEIEVNRDHGHNGMYLLNFKLNDKTYTLELYENSRISKGRQLCLELERIMKDAFDIRGS